MKKLYSIFSVRFFKRLFLSIILLMILIPSGLSIFFALQCSELNAMLATLPAIRQESLSLSIDDKVRQLAYQSMYPDLYAKEAAARIRTSGKAYLTFDDGPSAVTEQVLDALKAKNVKATFFVIGSNLQNERGKELLARVAAEGHTIGIHTYTHQYKEIYSSVESYLEDFNKVYTAIYDITGIKVTVFRFPGGSVNTYNAAIYQEIIAEMTRRGFTYYDWNVSSQDATGKSMTPQNIADAVVSQTANKQTAIVLMHDSTSKGNTALALPAIIDQLIAQGFTLEALTNTVEPINFGYIE